MCESHDSAFRYKDAASVELPWSKDIREQH